MVDIKKDLNSHMVKSLLTQGKRLDGRQKLEYRNVELVKNPLLNAEGSALARIGRTQVISAVKVDLAKPFPDRPDEGVLSTGAEFTPIGSPQFEPGPPSVEAIELARVVDRGIRSAEMVDLNALAIPGSEMVKAVYIDLWIVDHGGNLFDAAMLASVAALKNTRMPKVEGNQILRKEIEGTLPTNGTPVSCTFANHGGQFLLDPLHEEESGADGLITISTTGDKVCAVQKSGSAGFMQKDILELVDISFDKSKALRAIIDGQ